MHNPATQDTLNRFGESGNVPDLPTARMEGPERAPAAIIALTVRARPRLAASPNIEKINPLKVAFVNANRFTSAPALTSMIGIDSTSPSAGDGGCVALHLGVI